MLRNVARDDAVHADVLAREHRREALRERDDARFRRRVPEGIRRRAHRRPTGDVDDHAARVLVAEHAAGGARTVERAVQVDFDGVVPVGVREVPDLVARAAAVADASVVEHDVQPAEVFDRARDEVVAGGARLDVRRDDERAAAGCRAQSRRPPPGVRTPCGCRWRCRRRRRPARSPSPYRGRDCPR